MWPHPLGGTLYDKVSIPEKYQKTKKGCVKYQEEMVLDQLGVDCVTDPAGKPVGEASKPDKKDKGLRLGVEKADARSKFAF